jgi:O-acetyl-ADP-ribose deacetylase (regulator of RNase III)
MLKIIDKDLFNGHDDIIIHQCNCFKNWGRGIVIPMKAHYPKAYQADIKTNYADKDKLGTYTFWTGTSIHKDKQITVINAYGQFGCGMDRQRTTYEALKKAFKKANEEFPEGTIGMPKIGCGLGGGDWNIVLKIIEEAFPDRQVTIYEPAKYKK